MQWFHLPETCGSTRLGHNEARRGGSCRGRGSSEPRVNLDPRPLCPRQVWLDAKQMKLSEDREVPEGSNASEEERLLASFFFNIFMSVFIYFDVCIQI